MFNETKWYDEKATYRAVTGASGYFPRADGVPTVASFPAKGTIPIARDPAPTGTISSDGTKVMAVTNMNFETVSLKVGDYIYNADAQIRKITAILSKDLLEIESPFTVDLSGAKLLICERQFFKAIHARNTHASDAAILQESTFIAGDSFLNGGAPIVYDATAGQISFVCSK